MKLKKNHIVFALLLQLSAVTAFAQISSLTPVLVSSAGNFYTDNNANLSLSSSVGEPVILTLSTSSTTNQTRILTQGFQQPRLSGALVLQATLTYSNASCTGASDGTAILSTSGGAGGYTYVWSNGDTTSRADSLAPGNYSVTVTDAGGLSITQTVTIADGTELCGVQVYNGFSPNGDGKNDYWHIEFIDLFQPNSVAVFDRWGTEIWSGENYDNLKVFWDGKNKQGQELPDGTYFYIIKVGDKIQKDWVELTR